MTELIIKKEIIDFKDLVENDGNKININFQSQLINELNNEFTNEEQRWFIANFYVFLNYHPTDDFPINLENVYNMIGFANKGNAKRTLINNFEENKDFKIVILPRENNLKKDLGGRNEEKLLLNVDTFKMLCMLAKTDKGKKIRSYYVKLENINNKILKQQMEESNNKLIEKENQLKLKDDTIKLLENKPETEGFIRVNGYIYIIKDNSKIGHYKIGLSEAPDKRIIGLNVSSSTNSFEIVDTYKTNDSILTEKIIHAILFPNKIKKQKEWFYIHNKELLEYVKKVIVDSIKFLDSYIFNSINDQIHFLNNDKKENKKNYKKMVSKEIQTEIEAVKIINLQSTTDKDEIIFNSFFENCCEIDNLVSCTKRDLIYQYKTWSKMNNLYNSDKFEIYLLSKFKTKKLYNEFFKTEMSHLLGIKLKDSFYHFHFQEPYKELEQFLIDSCVKLPTGKLNRTSVKDVYKKWCTENNKPMPNNTDDINKLCKFIDKYFFKDLFYSGTSSYHGWYGITLKENFLQGTGLSSRMCIKNKIYKIYIENPKEIVKEWESQKEAARELIINYSTLGNRLKQKILFMDTNKKEFYLIKEDDYKKLL
jgi:phage anti-repressor protein